MKLTITSPLKPVFDNEAMTFVHLTEARGQ